MDIFKEFTFDAAHSLERLSPNHKCHSVHGHTYKLRVILSGSVDPRSGMVIDFGEITALVKAEVLSVLDHKYLNDVAGLDNPTCEVLATWVWHRLKKLPLKEITVFETPTCGATYNGE